MPAYFSMTLQFENKKLKPYFVEELYSKIISCGFEFKSGYWFHENASLREIIDWNQNLLEQGFELGYDQHVKHDYMQILFDSEMYSEFRGFWMYSDEQITFNLIIPESDILNQEGGNAFVDKKVFPVKGLALFLWESISVDVIQTHLELEGGCFSLAEVSRGENISVSPFAILRGDYFKKFPLKHFEDDILTELKDGGVLIENSKSVFCYSL